MPRGSTIEVTGPLRGLPGAARLPRDLDRLRVLARRRAGRPVSIGVWCCSDAEIRRLHRRHLGADRATDVVSFPLSEADDATLVGAVAASRDTARREAGRRGVAPYHEWMLYVVHGILHLLGEDDGDARSSARMRRAEREWLTALGLPSVFDEAPRRRRTREAK